MTGQTMLSADDRAELRELVERYALSVDARDFAAAGALFTEDGELALPEPPAQLSPARLVTGRPAIERELGGLVAFAVTFHGVTGHSIQGAQHGDAAEGRVNCIAHHMSAGDGAARDLVWYMRYRDDYRRTAAGWRFARRSIHVEAIDAGPLKRVNETPLRERTGLGAW